MERKIIRGLDEVKQYVSKLGYPLAIDIETTDLSLSKLKLRGISYCDDALNLYVDLDNNNEHNSIINFLKEYYKQDEGKILIMHNASFDLTGLSKFGIDLSNYRVWDTATGDHLLDENRTHRLKDIAERELGVKTKSFDEANVDHDTFCEYALNDSLWTYQIYKKQLVQLQKEDLLFLMEKIEMPYNHVLAQMRETGMLVDWKLNKELMDKAEDHLINLELELYSILGEKCSKQFNLLDDNIVVKGKYKFTSNDNVADIITSKLNLTLSETTATGKPKVDKHILNNMKGEHKFIDKLLHFRKMIKLYNSFLSPLNDFREDDDVIRPSFINWGTRTGRLSSGKPNLQQLPNAKDEDEFQIRKQFIAPPGYKMIATDYSGQELRVMALVSRDMKMIGAIAGGDDLHQKTADLMGVERKDAKTINFGIAYGKEAYGFSKDFGISEDEAQKILDRFFNAYPDLKRSIEDTHKQVISQGWVCTPTKRKRRFKMNENYVDKKALRQSFNFKIQSLSADMIRIASNKVFKLGKKNPQWGLKQVATVHDENVYIIKEQFVNEALPRIEKQFTNAIKSKLVFEVESGVGDNYQEAK